MECDIGVTCVCGEEEECNVGKGNLDSLNKTCLEVYIDYVMGSKHR